MVPRRLHHLLHPLGAADIARVDAQAGRAGLGRLDGAAVVEVDVGDERHVHLAHDLGQRRRALLVGHGDADDVGPRHLQRRICAIVAAASSVGVLVMVCTVIGESPPTGTLPTMIWREARRAICW